MRFLAKQTQVVALIATALLVGCQHKSPPPPQPLSREQRDCRLHCADMHRYCLHQQQKIYHQCRELAHQHAKLNYQAYSRDQMAKGKKPSQLKKSPKDFYSAWRCDQQLDCAGEDKLCQHSCE